MHACGHDMHVTWLVGATTLLAQTRDGWQGTLMAVFQPAEETAEGAQAMIDDGLFERFPKPDVVLGQHVMVGPAGAIGGRAGVITSAADSLQIRLFGRGAHGSMPQASIDPVVMAAATVLRLQTIVSRELAPTEAAVVTDRLAAGRHQGERDPRRGRHQAQRAHLRRGRAQARARRDQAHRQRRGRRLRRAEAAGDHAAGPLFPGHQRRRRRPRASSRPSASTFPPSASARPDRRRRARTSARSAPSGTRRRCSGSSAAPTPTPTRKRRPQNRLNEIPTNHNPRFLPVIHPTLQTGVEALIVAARAWLTATP